MPILSKNDLRFIDLILLHFEEIRAMYKSPQHLCRWLILLYLSTSLTTISWCPSFFSCSVAVFFCLHLSFSLKSQFRCNTLVCVVLTRKTMPKHLYLILLIWNLLVLTSPIFFKIFWPFFFNSVQMLKVRTSPKHPSRNKMKYQDTE